MTTGREKLDLSRLKQAMPIMDLAKSLGLEIKGRQARCFNSQAHAHNDRSFSLGLDTQRNRFKCFACGEQGSNIDLLMAIRGIDVKEAIKELAEMTGLAPMSHTTHQTHKTTLQATTEAINDTTEAYSEIYEEFYFYCIGLDQESETYLKKRGLEQETLDSFLLFNVKDYQATNEHLKSKFSADLLSKSGIVGDKGNLIFYKHTIIIPFLQDDRIVFLQGRRLDQEQPKYLNLKTPVPLYNRDTLKKAESKIYIAEGVFDAMMLEQNGYNAVAILGVNNFKPDYVDLFKELDVILVLDNDEAGERGKEVLSGMFHSKGQGVSSKQLPDGVKDITDYFLSL